MMHGSKETPTDAIRDLAKKHFNRELDDSLVWKIKDKADYQWTATVMKALECLTEPF